MREIIEKGAREGDTRVKRDGLIRQQSFESVFIPTRVDGAFNHRRERFKKDAVSVSGFTGFVRTGGRFVYERKL